MKAPNQTVRSRLLLQTALLATVLVFATDSTAADPAPPVLPFSPAVLVDGVLYTSGQIGVKAGENHLAPGGMPAEAKQAMDNIGAVLAANGMTFDDVFRCTVALSDMSKWGDFNAVYVTYFKTGPLPARSAFGASALAYGGQVEIDCMARKGWKSAPR
jgi:2-iminobutanoate/2-iminopropanoate deaminase